MTVCIAVSMFEVSNVGSTDIDADSLMKSTDVSKTISRLNSSLEEYFFQSVTSDNGSGIKRALRMQVLEK